MKAAVRARVCVCVHMLKWESETRGMYEGGCACACVCLCTYAPVAAEA